MYVQQQPRSGGNDSCLMGCLAALCVCCTLDMLLSQIYLLPVLLFFFFFIRCLFCLLNSFIITIIIIVIFKVLFNIIANITAITTISLSRNEMKFNLITRFVEIFPFAI